MTNDPVPVAVVGAGNMGANHVRVYDELPEADLVEVVEPDPDRAHRVAEEFDVAVHESVDEITDARAATVAVPSRHHRDVATACLEEGLDVLVEKPLATSVADARAIVDAAETRERVLQVGHIERFNPAVEALARILDEEQLIAIEAHRLGPFNEHLADQDVVLDLMIHDIDVIDSLVDGTISEFHALGATPRSEATDHVLLQMKYGNGILGTATASHVTHGKVRTIHATTHDAYIELNYQDQSISIQRRGTEETTSLLDQSGYRTETVTESPYIQTREPLKNELEHFLDCVRTRDTPRVDGETGIHAVARAVAVRDRV